MAGKPGRSGGKREGAGRKPKDPCLVSPDMAPLDFLQAVMTGAIEASAIQVKAAIAAASYVHAKKGHGGKKGERQDAAGKVAGGTRFAPTKGPRLVVNNTK